MWTLFPQQQLNTNFQCAMHTLQILSEMVTFTLAVLLNDHRNREQQLIGYIYNKSYQAAKANRDI